MMNVDDFLHSAGSFLISSNPLLERLFLASLELAMLSLLVAVLIKVARVRSPRIQFFLWLVVFIKPLVSLSSGSPLAIVLEIPQSRIGTSPEGLLSGTQPLSQFQPLPTSDFAVHAPAVESNEAGILDGTAPALPKAGGSTADSEVIPSESSFYDLLPHLIVGGWLAGVLLLLGYHCCCRIRLSRILRYAEPASDSIKSRYQAVASQLALKRLPRLVFTDRLESPAITGVLWPTILIPSWLAEEGDPRFEWSVRHELTHWKWFDPAAICVRDLATILFYFHPSIWWASKRLVESMELACDRAMIQDSNDAVDYAERLYQMLVRVRERRRVPVAGGLFATRTQIDKRITALLDGAVTLPPQLTSYSVIGVAVVATVALSCGGAIRNGSVPQEEESWFKSTGIAETASGPAKDTPPRPKELRVLYLEGDPRWEYRYLKNALIRDRSINAQTFLCSAGADFTQEASPGAPPLKSLPQSLKELEEYDVVILGDVPEETLRSGEPLLVSLLVDYVKNRGGGLVAITGTRFPTQSGIEELLPVSFTAAEKGVAPGTPINPKLTKEGEESDVLRLSDDRETNLEIWEKRLPGVYYYRHDVKAKPGSDVLALIPEKSGGGSSIPVYVAGSAGKGKTFFAGTDQSWRWRAGVDNLYFYRFWKQVIQYVSS